MDEIAEISLLLLLHIDYADGALTDEGPGLSGHVRDVDAYDEDLHHGTMRIEERLNPFGEHRATLGLAYRLKSALLRDVERLPTEIFQAALTQVERGSVVVGYVKE